MKVAVMDACIFIDLFDLKLTRQFFALELEIHTSADVIAELYKEQQLSLLDYVHSNQLQVHSLLETDRIVMADFRFPRALSENDKTVLYLAKQIGAAVLSSDHAVRKHALTHGLECHGMLWVLDTLVAYTRITAAEAHQKLQTLVTSNLMYRTNVKLDAEIQKRLQQWC